LVPTGKNSATFSAAGRPVRLSHQALTWGSASTRVAYSVAMNGEMTEVSKTEEVAGEILALTHAVFFAQNFYRRRP
jgi:hypothetical protein